jgi:Uma2 family endonuclease
MQMPEETRVPIETYLRSTYEPDAEYVDGQIEERPAALYEHSAWQGAIMYWFDPHAKEWNICILPSLRIRVAPTRIRVPDVAIFDRDQPREQVPACAPVAVFEVLSAEDTLSRMMRKLDDYAAMGIPQIRVIDPEMKRYFRFENGELHKASTFASPDRGIQFEITEIEKLLN